MGLEKGARDTHFGGRTAPEKRTKCSKTAAPRQGRAACTCKAGLVLILEQNRLSDARIALRPDADMVKGSVFQVPGGVRAGCRTTFAVAARRAGTHDSRRGSGQRT